MEKNGIVEKLLSQIEESRVSDLDGKDIQVDPVKKDNFV